VMDGRYLIQTK